MLNKTESNICYEHIRITTNIWSVLLCTCKRAKNSEVYRIAKNELECVCADFVIRIWTVDSVTWWAVMPLNTQVDTPSL